MRNVILNIAVILSGITLLGSPVCALLYDFEDENQFSDWNVIQGSWSIIDGKLDGEGPQTGVFIGDHQPIIATVVQYLLEPCGNCQTAFRIECVSGASSKHNSGLSWHFMALHGTF